MHIQNRSQPPRAAAGALVTAVLLTLTHAMTATAQNRMPPLTEDEMTPEQKAAGEVFKEARDTDRVGGPFMVMLRSPEMMNRARNVGDYVRFRSALPPRLSEFVILLTARHWTQNYEWYVHAPIAEREGLDAAIIEAVADGRRPEASPPTRPPSTTSAWSCCATTRSATRPMRAWCRTSARRASSTPSASWATTRLLAMVMNTARTPLPDGVEPGLSSFPR